VLSLVLYNDAKGSSSGRGVFELVVGDSAATSTGSSSEDIDGEAATMAILLTCPRTVLVLSLVLSIAMPTEVPLDMRVFELLVVECCNIQVGSARKDIDGGSW
jgi:hypothetical protein